MSAPVFDPDPSGPVNRDEGNMTFGGGGVAAAASSDPQVFSGNYGGGAPTDVPTTTAAFAYDLDSPFDQWVWDGAAWV